MAEQRRADLQRMTDRFRDLAQDETRRTRQLFDEHREFFVDDNDVADLTLVHDKSFVLKT